MPARSTTLRRRLLHLLWWPLLAVLLLSAVYDYLGALDRARAEQDLALERVAIALASRLDVDADDLLDGDLGAHLDRTMAAMQLATRQDRLSFLVHRADNSRLAGDLALAALADAPAGAAAAYADRRFAGESVRLVDYPHTAPIGPVRILVAETTRRREAQARRVLIDTLVPNLLLVGCVLLLVQGGVRRAMQPLDRLGTAVAARAPDDLRPLPTDPVPGGGVPGEVLPLVRAINRHMAHLQLAAAAQQTFLSNAAHQLRTPLAGIQTQLELAARQADPAQRGRLEAAIGALQRVTHTTHQMLALARAAPPSAQANPFEPVDLQPLVELAASQWLDQSLAAGIDLGFDAQPAPVHGSPWMLAELLGNLIDNTLRHCPAGSRATVRCGTAPDGAGWLSVEDDGPGIAPAERDKVLARFYQAPGAGPGGSGLGLAIVQEVALRHAALLSLQDGPGSPAGRGLRILVRFAPAPRLQG